MLTHEKPLQTATTIPFSLIVTPSPSVAHVQTAIQRILRACGPEAVIGGRYGAWMHGLLPTPGSLIIFQARRRAIPLLAHPCIQIRHDYLSRNTRAQGQVVSVVDAAADMACFAHSDREAVRLTWRYLDRGGDANALIDAIEKRPGRLHAKAMMEVLMTKRAL